MPIETREILLHGQSAYAAMLEAIIPTILPKWDGTNEHVVVLEQLPSGQARGGFFSKVDAATMLRQRAINETRPNVIAGLREVATLVRKGPPGPDVVQCVFLTPEGCVAGTVPIELLRNPPPSSLDELASLILAFESQERALTLLEQERLLIRADLGEDVTELAWLSEVVANRWKDTSALAVATGKAGAAVAKLLQTPAVGRAAFVLDALATSLAQRGGTRVPTGGGKA